MASAQFNLPVITAKSRTSHVSPAASVCSSPRESFASKFYY